jgi:hypothetical protein
MGFFVVKYMMAVINVPLAQGYGFSSFAFEKLLDVCAIMTKHKIG